jgi:hypothetical protein
MGARIGYPNDRAALRIENRFRTKRSPYQFSPRQYSRAEPEPVKSDETRSVHAPLGARSSRRSWATWAGWAGHDRTAVGWRRKRSPGPRPDAHESRRRCRSGPRRACGSRSRNGGARRRSRRRTRRRKARASSMEPNRSGKAGQYLRVLNWASLYGLSLLTWGRIQMKKGLPRGDVIIRNGPSRTSKSQIIDLHGRSVLLASRTWSRRAAHRMEGDGHDGLGRPSHLVASTLWGCRPPGNSSRRHPRDRCAQISLAPTSRTCDQRAIPPWRLGKGKATHFLADTNCFMGDKFGVTRCRPRPRGALKSSPPCRPQMVAPRWIRCMALMRATRARFVSHPRQGSRDLHPGIDDRSVR